MKRIKRLIQISALVFLGLFLVQCNNDDENVTYQRPETAAESTHPNDVYLNEHMMDTYGTAVRWRWDNRFISPTQHATPIKSNYVIPVTKVVEYLWIGAYESQGEKGKAFIEELFPPELQFIGSYIYQNDGSKLLGYAEAGARITLLNTNGYDLSNRSWLTNPGGGILATVHHEFSHIVHQKHGLPQGFKGVSDYVGNGWLNIDNDEALKLGAVRNYGAMNEFEDFCEIVSHFLIMPKAQFESLYLEQKDCQEEAKTEVPAPKDDATDAAKAKYKTDLETFLKDCAEKNEGREKIAIKLNLIIDFYKKEFGLDLVKMRDELEAKINDVVENNEIPENDENK